MFLLPLALGESLSICRLLSVSKGFGSGVLVELVAFAFEDESSSEHRDLKMA